MVRKDFGHPQGLERQPGPPCRIAKVHCKLDHTIEPLREIFEGDNGRCRPDDWYDQGLKRIRFWQ
jgi:hypothetical protein